MISDSFDSILTESASTKRKTFTAGTETAPAEYIAALDVTPLAPVDPIIKHQQNFRTPHEVLTAFTDGALDIKEGDILVMNSQEYPIIGVADWTYKDVSFKQLYLEDPKR